MRAAGAVERWADIAVLTRRNADIAPLYAELTARDVPVEIVGLGGLLHLPEVMDVTATLRLVDDVTANPDLIRLLTGPRWRIGPARPGPARPAGAAAGPAGRTPRPTPDAGRRRRCCSTALEQAVADVDPTEVVSLLDALESPGEEAYSDGGPGAVRPAGRRAGYLRRHADEPVLDLARRVIATLGLDVELLADPGVRPDRPARPARARSSTRWPPTSTWTATPR